MADIKELYYENQGTMTYLVYAVKPEDELDSMSLGMLTNNRIPGLAQTYFMQLNDRQYLRYNVSAKVPVSLFFSGTVNRRQLLGVFRGIVDAMLSAEDYMLDIRNIVLDMDYMFADVSTCKTVLICLPLEVQDMDDTSEKTAWNPHDFFKNIMFTTQFDQTENCDHVAKILNYLSSTPLFSLRQFQEVLKELEKEADHDLKEKERPDASKTSKNSIVNMEHRSESDEKKVMKTVEKETEEKTVAKPSVIETTTKEKADKEALATSEPEMSLWYLMQHYNKENKATYDAQKAAKKKNSSGKKNDKEPEKQIESKNANDINANGVKCEFAVPGMDQVQKQTTADTSAQTGKKNVVNQHIVNTMEEASASETMEETSASKAMEYHAPTMEEVTTVVQNPGETTVLRQGQETVQGVPFLIRRRSNERISIDKPIFKIGKERSYADYFISDNTAISRSHANIIQREADYFLIDTNSTNHTFLNGKMLQSNEEVRLANGDIIRLANEDFEFRLY